MQDNYDKMTDAELDLELARRSKQADNYDQMSDEELDALILQRSKQGQMKPGLMEEAQRMLDSGEIKEQEKGSLSEAVLQNLLDPLVAGNLPKMQAGLESFLTPKPGEVGFSGTNIQGETPEETDLKIQALSPSELIALQSNLTASQVDELLRRKGITQKPEKSNEQQFRERAEMLEQEYPIASGAAKVAGTALATVGTAPLMAGKAVKQLASGAILGLAQDVGEQDSLTDEVKERLKNAALSAGISLVPEAGIKVAKITKDAISKAIPKNFVKGVVSSVTGVPEQQISTYLRRTDEVNSLIKRSSGDIEGLTDEARDAMSVSLKNTRLEMNKKISDALEKVSPEKTIPTNQFIDPILKIRQGLNENLEKDAIESLDDMIATVKSMGDNISIGELNKLKEYFRSNGKFQKNYKGQIFLNPEQSQRAANASFRAAKLALDEAAPQIKQANTVLARLHHLEDTINKSLVSSGKPSGAFLSAGAGVNKRSEKILKKIGEITGTNPLQAARDISAARAFTDPSLIAEGTTGKTLTRMAAGGAIGGALSTVLDGDQLTGASIGAALSSPFALKQLIQSGNISKKVLRNSIKQLSNPMVKSTLVNQFNLKSRERNRARNILENELKGENNE